MNWLQKYGMLLIAIAIAAYAIHGLMGADLVMPYSLGGLVRVDKVYPFARDVGDWGIHLPSAQRRRFRPSVLRETDRETRHKARQGTPPKTGRRFDPRRRIFFAGVDALGKSFAHSSKNGGMIEGETPRQFLDSHRPK